MTLDLDRGLPPQSSAARTHTFHIEVVRRREVTTTGGDLVRAAHQLGVTGVIACQVDRLFFLQGNLTPADVEWLSRELLADPVTETFAITSDVGAGLAPAPAGDVGATLAVALGAGTRPAPTAPSDHIVEVTLLPGVTDPAAENLVRAAHLLGVTALERAATGQRYRVWGELSERDLGRLATGVFSNPVVQRYAIDQPIAPPFISPQPPDDTAEIIPLRTADDQALLEISTIRRLALDLAEMQAIRAYFQGEERDPTDAELETLAQTWSEHCVHKTFQAAINYTGPMPGVVIGAPPTGQTIDGLLKTTIRAATEKVAKPWVRSAFVDNAGVIVFDDEWDLAFKLETHNHPSALEPFGGSNTGVGGVVRDILGVSARPIANTDVLCFGPPDLLEADLPAGVLHPRRIADGVVHGIEDYGNKMGIPTVNGAILYHPGYTANPLVFCGCLGLLPRGAHPSEPRPGDLIAVIGGRTGRDGLRGATFSSMEMDQATGEIAGSAVQIGHPIHEKQVLEVVLRARDERLYHAVTDCGAGGLSSAVGEMGRTLGARVQLDRVPLKYPGLRAWEIWLSEAQERMVLAVPPENWARLQALCAGQDVEAVCIGEFAADGRLYLYYGERPVGELAMDFLHDGIPRRHLDASWQPPARETPHGAPTGPFDLTPALMALLTQPDIRSKEPVIRRYDHEVQGGTAVKPLVGAADQGPGDATVLVPLGTSGPRGLALSVGICPAYGELDPYAMAWAAIDEAMRNAVAVGADPDQVALLDNFCWGNPSLPDRLGSLVRCAQGCYDAALAYGTPFISGKDSLNNEYLGADGRKHAIPGTLLISALAIVPDVSRTTSMDLKQAGDWLYLVGETWAELGGSHYVLLSTPATRGLDRIPPQPVPGALEHLRAVHRAIAAGWVRACHDCSEGGLSVALAEMCLAGRLGAEVELALIPGADRIARDDEVLYSESLCRFVVEVRPEDAPAFEAALASVPHARIGRVVEGEWLRVRGRRGQDVLSAPVADLETAWCGSDLTPAPSPERGGKSVSPFPEREGGQGVRSKRRKRSHAGARRVLVLHANGTNRDREAALACELAGAQAEIVHVNQLLAGERRLLDYHMLVVPGGFSYGDDLGAGTLWALDLRHRLGDDVARFVASGRPVLGICNGFQALVKAGLLPGADWRPGRERSVTLAPNALAHFECRWVYLKPNPHSPCLFTTGLEDLIYCPVAHGEGRFATRDDETLAAIAAEGLAALTYVDAAGQPAGYPANPNGSAGGIAGLCNPAGNVLGLMPHPEDHIFPWHHPRWQRGEAGMIGLRLFANGVRYA
jgi:phosphoribosylformylglycinamidine synthase II/phosphoribosylformylglycinamidine synthase I